MGILLLGALPITTAACTGELRDLDDAAMADAAAPTPVPGFSPTIQRDLDQLGCSAGGSCHGGSAAMHVVAMPIDATTLAANFDEVRSRASSGADSLLLRKPLAGGGVTHGGGALFPSTADPVYRRWLAWIAAGAPLEAPADAGSGDAGTYDGGAAADASPDGGAG